MSQRCAVNHGSNLKLLKVQIYTKVFSHRFYYPLKTTPVPNKRSYLVLTFHNFYHEGTEEVNSLHRVKKCSQFIIV